MVIIVAALAALFGALSWLVAGGHSLQFDTQLLQFIHAHSTDILTLWFSLITNLGDPIILLPLGLILCAMLLRRERYNQAAVVTALFVMSGLITGVLKTVFDRVRPDIWPHSTIEHSFSFPSGHATTSMIIALTIIYLSRKARRPIFVFLLALYVLMIGLSRPYLGVHYPTDILGGWLVAGFSFAVVMTALRAWTTYRHRHAVK